MDGWTDGWMENQAFLPSFLGPLVGSGPGSELPAVVIKPAEFAAMTFNTSGMIRNLRTDRGRLRWAPGPGSWARPMLGSLPSWEGQAGGGRRPSLVAGASRMAQQWAHGAAREGWRVDVLGWAGERTKELRAPGLREARAARPPAGGPIATVAAATTLQAVVVIHVTAAANTVQLTGAKLHALHIHFWGEQRGWRWALQRARGVPFKVGGSLPFREEAEALGPG